MSQKNPTTRKFIERFEGIFPALVTPFTETGSIDLPAVKKLVRYLVDGGVQGIWALGSGGEFPMLTAENRRTFIRAVAEAIGGSVPLIAGVSDTALPRAIANAEMFKADGADAIFVLPPYYYLMGSAEATRFLMEVAERSPLPLVVYHNPFNAKVRLELEDVRLMMDHPNIAGIKDSSCDLVFFQKLLDMAGGREDFRIFQGHDPLLAQALLMGANGAVVAVAGVAPRLTAALFKAAVSGDMTTAQRLGRQCRELEIVFAVDGEGTDANFLAGQKAAMELLGLCSRWPAFPFKPLGNEQVQIIRRAMERNGLLKQVPKE